MNKLLKISFINVLLHIIVCLLCEEKIKQFVYFFIIVPGSGFEPDETYSIRVEYNGKNNV